MTVWLAPRPLLLASASRIRRALLAQAGVAVEACVADVDERAVEADAGARHPHTVAALLARAKASEVGRRNSGRLVLGADQVLALDSRRFSKPGDRPTARAQLAALRGKTHELHTALAFVEGGEVVFEHVGIARLTMRAFSDRFLDAYLDAVGAAATTSVGAYQLEGLGIELFERVEGDYFTVLGLPLLVALDFLRRRGCLLS